VAGGRADRVTQSNVQRTNARNFNMLADAAR
jgi:hypothetical protein